MADFRYSDSYSGSSPQHGESRNQKRHLSLEIRVEDVDGDRADSAPVSRANLTSVGSHGDTTGFKEYRGSLKGKKALLQHFLHPLDYYHERKSRSSSTSINSDCGSDISPGELTPRSRTPEPQVKFKSKLLSRPLTPTILHSSPAWPSYKPALQKRVSAPVSRKTFTPSPLASPFGSPGQCDSYASSPSPIQHSTFYNDVMHNPGTRFPDGHRDSRPDREFDNTRGRRELESSSGSENETDSPWSSDQDSEEELAGPRSWNCSRDIRSDQHLTVGYNSGSPRKKTENKHSKLRRHADGNDEVFDDNDGADLSKCIHLGLKSDKSILKHTSSVEKLYSVYEDIIREGQLVRRHSMEPERKRNGSGHTYFRGEDPDQATIVFRDCRGLPVTAPFLENVRRSDLEENESQIMVKFFKYHTTYDLIPTSAKLVVFDTKLQVKKAFYALVYNGVRAAPLWDSGRQRFVGMLTITDFIRILQSFYNCPNRKMDELEEHRLELWRTLLHDDVRELISIKPIETLYEAIRSLIHHKIHRLPVIDPDTGSVLYIITHKRILKFLYLYINELPKPSIMLKSLRELNIGTYDNIETARGDTLIIEALNKFVERRISALPIVDDEGRLVDIYAKFDVINLAAEGTYHNLDVTLQQANEYRNEWFEGVLKCTLDETLEMVMERIVRAEVHRLVIVDESNKVIGIISLSDILNELVLKPCHDDPLSLKGRPVSDIVAGIKSSPGNSARSRESLKRDSSSSNKTGSEESVEVTCWGNMSDAKSDERRTSIPETIDGRQYDRPMDRTQHEILPISS